MTKDSDLDDEFDDDIDLLALETAKKTKPVSAGSIRPTIAKSPPTHHKIDPSQVSTYVYPTNLPIRDYQYSIVNRALFHNVLVALPTGLGKTFIASTVMLNYLRWFPELKIIFMAPTKPLVAQQIKACCGITGIPSSRVAILLDRTRKNRAEIWDEKSVFFTTPQVVENDLTAGTVDPRLILLLVVDEAHRAKGNYAYNNVVKFVSRFSKSFRILALTATPAADVDGVQEIVNNLHISFVEVRTENSIDIFKYLKRKKVERISADLGEDVKWAVDIICKAATPILRAANEKGIYDITDPQRINAFTALDAQRRLVRNNATPEGLKWANYFILQLLIVIGQCLRRLNVYGLRAFYLYFLEKHKEFSTKHKSGKSKNQTAAKFYFHPSMRELLSKCETLVLNPAFLGHHKLEIVLSELELFFANTHENSRVIIFTEFRQSALDIVRAVENNDTSKKLRPHIFIGQAKEKEKFDEAAYLSKSQKKIAEKKTKIGYVSTAADSQLTSSELAQLGGMNQKMQKQLIKKFRDGTYNILVATSIGEEGLDIGEVDLIICYDLTSSPIKNIQRMGRTGRNREGKVILLFSSNEESKFDKAMAGYEYIQQHIMKGLVEVKPQNRILPENCTPVVEEKEIEIPRENLEIKQEEDEDEIIRIATKYMIGTHVDSKTGPSGGPKAKRRARDVKIKSEKRFFMPDDVETGFRPAGLILRAESQTLKRQRVEERVPDFLDSLVDSEDENLPMATAEDVLTDLVEEIATPGIATEDFNSRQDLQELSKPPSINQSKILRQPEIFNWCSSIGVIEADSDTAESTKFSELNEANSVSTGPKKRVEPKKYDEEKDLREADDRDFSDDEDIIALAKITQNHWDKENRQSENDITRVGAKPGKSQFYESRDTSHARKNTDDVTEANTEPRFPTSTSDGLLTNLQKQELYLHYYTTPDHNLPEFCNLLHVPQDGYGIEHSQRSKRYISFRLFLMNMTEKEATDLLESYDIITATKKN